MVNKEYAELWAIDDRVRIPNEGPVPSETVYFLNPDFQGLKLDSVLSPGENVRIQVFPGSSFVLNSGRHEIQSGEEEEDKCAIISPKLAPSFLRALVFFLKRASDPSLAENEASLIMSDTPELTLDTDGVELCPRPIQIGEEVVMENVDYLFAFGKEGILLNSVLTDGEDTEFGVWYPSKLGQCMLDKTEDGLVFSFRYESLQLSPNDSKRKTICFRLTAQVILKVATYEEFGEKVKDYFKKGKPDDTELRKIVEYRVFAEREEGE